MGLDPAGRTPTLSGTPAGGARSSMGCRRRCCSPGWDTGPWRRPSGTCSWPAAIPPKLKPR